MTAPKPIPGLRGIEHIGLTVPDMDAAIEFFETVLGCETIFEVGPLSSTDDWMQVQLNVRHDAVIHRIVFLRCANGSNLELFEYEASDQAETPPKNSDIGGHHLAFYVDDFDAAVQGLKDHGVRVLGEPVSRASGLTAGMTWIYFLAPWGLQCELVSFPNGRAYEETVETKLWHPVSS